jgi:plasmid maintenance system killer protein
VISKVRPSFWRAYEKLAPVIQARARQAYQVFAADPNHPSLHFKKLQGSGEIWSVRINEQYRAVGVRSGDTIEWIWIGSHNEFDNLFS